MKIIVIDGLEGSGKKVQIKFLLNYLNKYNNVIYKPFIEANSNVSKEILYNIMLFKNTSSSNEHRYILEELKMLYYYNMSKFYKWVNDNKEKYDYIILDKSFIYLDVINYYSICITSKDTKHILGDMNIRNYIKNYKLEYIDICERYMDVRFNNYICNIVLDTNSSEAFRRINNDIPKDKYYIEHTSNDLHYELSNIMYNLCNALGVRLISNEDATRTHKRIINIIEGENGE